MNATTIAFLYGFFALQTYLFVLKQSYLIFHFIQTRKLVLSVCLPYIKDQVIDRTKWKEMHIWPHKKDWIGNMFIRCACGS